jgi:hypothetical protein
VKKLVISIATMFALVVTVAAVGAASVKPDGKKNARDTAQHRVNAQLLSAKSSRAATTIQYDPGTAPDGVLTAADTSTIAMVGNHFNSDAGDPLLASGTISAFTFFPYSASNAVVISLIGPPMGGTGTSHIGFWVASPVVDSTFNVGSLTTPVGVGNSFIAGLYLGYFADYPGIGMASASYNSQGFHGMMANFLFDTGGNYAASGAEAISGQNAMFRVSGDLQLPVELMNFTVK